MFCHKGNRTKFFRDGVLVNVLMFLVKLSLSSKVGEKHYAVRSSTFEKKGDIIAYKKLGLSRFELKKNFLSKCFDILTSLRNTVSKADSKVLLQLLKILERLGQTFQLLKQSFTSHVLYQITTLKNAANLPENSNINFFLLVLGNFS